jgi:hypothetical protein
MKTFTFYFSEIGRETPKIEDSTGTIVPRSLSAPKFLQSEEWKPSVSKFY